MLHLAQDGHVFLICQLKKTIPRFFVSSWFKSENKTFIPEMCMPSPSEAKKLIKLFWQLILCFAKSLSNSSNTQKFF